LLWQDGVGAIFFKVPSLKNLSFAVLDTAAILPFVPSTRYIRTTADALDIAKDIKKLRWWENFLKRVTKIATKWNQSISAKAYEELYDFFKKDKKLADSIYNQFLSALWKEAGKTAQNWAKKLSWKPVTIQWLKDDKSFWTIIYDFELKIMWWQGKNYRLYWKYNSKWELIFEKFWKALH